LIRDIMDLIAAYSRLETKMLIQLHEKNPEIPLFALSELTSEQIFALQDEIQKHLEGVIEDQELVWKTMTQYIPSILVEKLGRKAITDLLSTEELTAYRNAVITKKLASMALYRFGLDWEAYLRSFRKDPIKALHQAVS
jgi:glutamate dehydrogenase